MGFAKMKPGSACLNWKMIVLQFVAQLSVGLAGVTQAGIITIDLTGYTGRNGDATFGDFRVKSGITGGNAGIAFFNGLFGSVYGVNVIDSSGQNLTKTATLGGAPVKFGPGATIDNSTWNWSSTLSEVGFRTITQVQADWGPNSFLGFRDELGRFGYLEATWTASTNSFYLISAAYESSPGTPIQTPSGAAVPEPATNAMLALAIGGAAFTHWRKKRRAEPVGL